ncbi:MAG: hypothetical protein ACYC6F_16340 [Longimicrobiales bacterium]
MNCGYCGKPFDEDRSQPACRQCPVGSGCGLVRCPHCGYENPGTPGWIAFLRKKLGGGDRPQPPARPEGLALPMLRPRP